LGAAGIFSALFQGTTRRAFLQRFSPPRRAFLPRFTRSCARAFSPHCGWAVAGAAQN